MPRPPITIHRSTLSIRTCRRVPTPAFTSKSPTAFRVLTLGGSTTRNFTLPEQDRYPHRLQELLQRDNPALSVEVFNAGMDWFATKHSVINYATNLRDWQPDLVIVMHGINDVYRSFSDPDVAMGPYDRLWSHFYGPSINGAKPPTFEQDRFVHWAPYWFSDLRYITYRERDVPLERYVALPDFKRNLGYLVHDVRNDGASVVLMTEPSLYKDTMTDEERAVLWFGRSFCKERKSFVDYEYPSPSSLGRAMSAFNMATKQLGAAEHVKVIDLDAEIAKNLENFSDDVHYRVAGAHQVAEVVAREIRDADLVRRVERP